MVSPEILAEREESENHEVSSSIEAAGSPWLRGQGVIPDPGVRSLADYEALGVWPRAVFFLGLAGVRLHVFRQSRFPHHNKNPPMAMISSSGGESASVWSSPAAPPIAMVIPNAKHISPANDLRPLNLGF